MKTGLPDSDFEKTVQEYTDYVFNLAYRILGSREDAKDVVQETFLKVHKNFQNVDPTKSLKNWICTIALNTSRDIYRNHRRRKEQNFEDPSEQNHTYPMDVVLDSKRQVEQVLQSLPLEFRMVIHLFYIEEKSLLEVSELLKIPLVLVKVRLYRARKFALKILKERSYGQP